MGGCTRVRKEKRAARRRRGSVVRKGFDERKDCLRKRHPARRRLAERRFRFDRVVVRARVFVGGFPERRPARSGGSRAAPEVGAEGSASNDAHPVSGSRERSGTSGSGTSGSGTFPRGASSETSRATGPASASAASASHRAATSAALGRDDGSVASACFTSALVFSLVLETTSGDHAKRPLSAASLASAPKGAGPPEAGTADTRAPRRPPGAQPRAPRRLDGARPTSPARGRWAWWFARTATPRGSGPAASKTRGRRRRGRSRSRTDATSTARTPRRRFFFGGRRGQHVLGLDVEVRHGRVARVHVRDRARRTRAGTQRVRLAEASKAPCALGEALLAQVHHQQRRAGEPARRFRRARFFLRLASRADENVVRVEGHDVVVRGHRGVHDALAARLLVGELGGKQTLFQRERRGLRFHSSKHIF